jgi:heme/copper-type cytochrome/quinol oxidase subunit 2
LDPNLPDVAATATITAGAVATETPKIEAAVGHTVEITVTSDVADELHIHGYDLFADLEPGVAVTLRFEADIPGIFEVELEGAHLAVFSLEVS